MKYEELEQKLKEALSLKEAAEIQLAVINLLPNLRDDYGVIETLATKTAEQEKEIERLKTVTAEYAVKSLSSFKNLDDLKDDKEDDKPRLGQDAYQEYLELSGKSKKEVDSNGTD